MNSSVNDNKTELFKHVVRIRNVLGMTAEDVVHAALKELKTLYGLDIEQPASDFILQIAGRRVFVTRRDVFLTQFDVISPFHCNNLFPNFSISALALRITEYLD